MLIDLLYVIAGIVFSLCFGAAVWMLWMLVHGRFRLSPGSMGSGGMKQKTCGACKGEGEVWRYGHSVVENCGDCQGLGYRWVSA